MWLVTAANFYGQPSRFYYLLDNYYILCPCLSIFPLFIHAVAEGLKGGFRGFRVFNDMKSLRVSRARPILTINLWVVEQENYNIFCFVFCCCVVSWSNYLRSIYKSHATTPSVSQYLSILKNIFVSLYLSLSSFNATLIIGLSIILLPIYCRERNNIMK
jgi:hypothetical protein